MLNGRLDYVYPVSEFRAKNGGQIFRAELDLSGAAARSKFLETSHIELGRDLLLGYRVPSTFSSAEACLGLSTVAMSSRKCQTGPS